MPIMFNKIPTGEDIYFSSKPINRKVYSNKTFIKKGENMPLDELDFKMLKKHLKRMIDDSDDLKKSISNIESLLEKNNALLEKKNELMEKQLKSIKEIEIEVKEEL